MRGCRCESSNHARLQPPPLQALTPRVRDSLPQPSLYQLWHISLGRAGFFGVALFAILPIRSEISVGLNGYESVCPVRLDGFEMLLHK
jgi:hypothetical protein